MNKKIDIIVADPSGNITIMVLTPAPREEYKDIAQGLLDIKELNGQQVAFILPEQEPASGSGASLFPEMEMCGLEFCGNASRAFAFYTAFSDTFISNDAAEIAYKKSITVKVSGCEHPLTADILPLSPEESAAAAGKSFMAANVTMEMPVPSEIHKLSASQLGINKHGLLVDMDGICHLILEDVAPSSQIFETVRDRIYETIDADLPAFGVMFCDTVNQLMTPVVYVKDVDTTYFEGSCASGTVAAAFALAQDLPDGMHDFTMQQPEGALHASVAKKEGRTEGISLKGLVTLSPVMSVKLPEASA